MAKKQHGMSHRHPLYSRWVGMRQRCNDVNSHAYSRYGGAGITVCREWDDFEKFLDDMGPHKEGQTIERIDNSKGYCKENCYWADTKQQSRNRSMTVWVEFNGKTMCVSDWAKEIGICFASMKERLEKWGKEKALTTPKQINGEWQHSRKENCG